MIWKIAFKGEDWNRWNKTFDISFWNQKYIEKEIMNDGTLLCDDGQTPIPFSISIPNANADSNDIEAHSTHLSNEDMSDLLQQSILDPERDEAQQELSNQSDSNETLESYKTSHQHDTIQMNVEKVLKTHGDHDNSSALAIDKPKNDGGHRMVSKDEEERRKGEEMGKKLAEKNLSKIAIHPAVTKTKTKAISNKKKKIPKKGSNKNTRYISIIYYGQFCISYNSQIFYALIRDQKINKHQGQEKVSYKSLFLLTLMLLYSYNIFDRLKI